MKYQSIADVEAGEKQTRLSVGQLVILTGLALSTLAYLASLVAHRVA